MRNLEEENAVCDSEHSEAAGEDDPHPVEAPAAQRERADNEAEHHQIAQWVGETCHDHCGARVGRAWEHGFDDHRRRDRGDPEGGYQPIERQTEPDVPDPAARQEDERDEGRRVRAEKERVGDRGDRHGILVDQEDRVVDVAEPP